MSLLIKEKKLEGEEKAQFWKDNAEPLWEDFKLWAANVILDVSKDSNIFRKRPKMNLVI